MKRVSSIVMLVALLRRIEIDSKQDPEYRMQRDALLRESIDADASKYVKLFQWLKQLDSRFIHECQRNISQLFLLVSFAGAIVGACVTIAVVAIDVPEPVNLLIAILVLVAIPLAFLLVSLCLVLPGDVLQKVPLLSEISQFFETLIPYRPVLNWVQSKLMGDASDLLLAKYSTPGLARYRRWLVLMFAQVMAASYAVSVCLMIFVIIAFTDVAFVWSTTLSVEPSDFHSLMLIISAPWSTLLPEAVPSLELVEHTRYFRMQSVNSHPEIYGAWWPFLVASVFFYGVLPRIFLMLFTFWKVQRVAIEEMWGCPGVEAVALRLTTPVLRPKDRNVSLPSTETRISNTNEIRVFELSTETNVFAIFWAFSETDSLVSRVKAVAESSPVNKYFVGGANSSAQDLEIVNELSAGAVSGSKVFFFVRAWEPPMTECLEYMKGLRQSLGESVEFAVVLSALVGIAMDDPALENQIEIWRDAIGPQIEMMVICDV